MTNSGAPTVPIPFGATAAEVTERLGGTRVPLPAALLADLAATGAEVLVSNEVTAEAGRDWWPLAMIWAVDGATPARAAAVVRPADADQVSAVMAACHAANVPVTPAAGRSGVCGASVPIHGGVVLDLTAMSGIVSVDRESMVLDVLPGTFGTWLEDTLQTEHRVTVGHWPQSMALSTVGGWLACRGAGQMSTRYGKIEDIVVGLDIVLADGRQITTGGAPRAAVGPDLNQLFVGSEGTLGIITGARLKLHSLPAAERRAAYAFRSFAEANDACRRIVQRDAHPAVLRLYDNIESDRTYKTGPDDHLLLVLDEGDPAIVDATMSVIAEECKDAELADVAFVEQWLGHRNDTSALQALISRDYVVDTMEIAAPWTRCVEIYDAVTAAIRSVPGTLAASAHQSHSYPDGACLYFTFAGQPPREEREQYYRDAWEAGTRAVLDRGGALSHHHGVGLNRSRFVRDALGPALDVLVAVKQALDPHGILNPGKLGLPDPWASGEEWPD
ncbi:MAG: FAD-binding oxidoreductase [Acidimicrobiia bacterium]|nr:FAD-binding oxidoreductase [Acidimicrobiia bacterium]